MKKLEAIVKPFKLDDLKKRVIAAARTGQIGDGKILVTPIEEVIRVRTGERGKDAI